jgi:hypothetical protein
MIHILKMKFKRPENLPFPQIYHTFMAKDKNSDEIVEYRIQDLPEELFDRVLEIYVTQFLKEEPATNGLNFMQKPSAIETMKRIWIISMKKKLSLVCLKSNGGDDIVGVNILDVSARDDTGDEFGVMKKISFC